MRVRP